MTRLEHVDWLSRFLKPSERLLRSLVGFLGRTGQGVRQSLPSFRRRFVSIGNSPLPADVAQVLIKASGLPDIKYPIKVMPEAYTDQWGMPSGIIAESGLVIPTAVRDVGCGYQLLHMPGNRLTQRDFSTLEHYIKELAGYSSEFRREYVHNLSVERILLEGMKYLVAVSLAEENELLFVERLGYVDDAALDGFEKRSLDIAGDYLGMFAEHFLEVREIDTIFQTYAARELGLSKGDFLVIIHSGSLGLRSELYCLFYVKLTRYLLKHAHEVKIDPKLISQGFFGVPQNSTLGRLFYSSARALMNYSYVNRYVIRKLVEKAFQEAFGFSSLRLLSDLCHLITFLKLSKRLIFFITQRKQLKAKMTGLLNYV